MIKLIVDNSICRLEGLTRDMEKELKELLSYSLDSQAAYFAKAYRTKRSLLTKRGEFPTGLLYLVHACFVRNHTYYQLEDIRKVPEKRPGLFTMQSKQTPYPEQLEAAKAAVDYKRGIISAPTGVGKSLICAHIINELQVPTLIVVPSLELKRQTIAGLKSIFKDGVQHITVKNVDALDPNETDNEHACVILDEFHHSGAKTYRKLNQKAWKNIYYKFGLTATPFRNQDNERLLLESVLSKVIYRIDYATAMAKGYICPVEAYYYELPKRKTNAYAWSEVYSELIVGNKVRNDLISSILKRLETANASTLCLVKEIAHGEDLKKRTGIPFANGLAEDTRILILEFALDERKALIGTTGVLGEGVDTKPAEYVIIAGLGKSRGAFTQQVGRGLRRYGNKTSCKVILFKDKSHKFTLRHFNEQVKFLKEEYGIEPIKLEMYD